MPNKQYLGDSVYVEFDEKLEALVLTTENGLPTDPSNTIVLEAPVWYNLKAYVKVLEKESQTPQSKES